MLADAPGTLAPTATEDMAAGLAQSAPAPAAPGPIPPSSLPVSVPADPAPGAPGAAAPDAAGPASGVTAPAEPTAPSAPAAPATPPPWMQAAQQVQQAQAGLQQAAQQFQYSQANLQARAQSLATLMQSLPPEDQERLLPQAQALLQEGAQLQAQRAQFGQTWDQLALAEQYVRLQQREADLEQHAGPLSVALLVQQAQKDTPGIDPEDMARTLAQYDANHLLAAKDMYVRLRREATLQQRAAHGTDHMGGASPAAPPANPHSTGVEDITAAMQQIYGHR